MRFRIVYIMNVDWDWLKQRPHFIAQHLSCAHDVLVVYPYAWRRGNLSKNDRNGLKLYPFFRLPLGGRFALIRYLNIITMRLVTRLFLRWSCPDFVWISSPELFEYLPKPISLKLVYDCMDDVLEFPRNAAWRSSLATSEKELISVSALVFCSSNNLHDKLMVRYGNSEKYCVSHNAFEPSAFLSGVEKNKFGRCSGAYILGYIGTISSWLDFEALVKIVHIFPSVEIHLVGPIENLEMSLPQHERIKFLGMIRHDAMQSLVNGFDALMIPFQVTELIQSVDPVKLYEYIFFDKPIVSVGYSEINRFSDFVDFYTNHVELIAIIKQYLDNGFMKKYSSGSRSDFIAKNTWAHRIVYIEKELELLKK